MCCYRTAHPGEHGLFEHTCRAVLTSYPRVRGGVGGQYLSSIAPAPRPRPRALQSSTRDADSELRARSIRSRLGKVVSRCSQTRVSLAIKVALYWSSPQRCTHCFLLGTRDVRRISTVQGSSCPWPRTRTHVCSSTALSPNVAMRSTPADGSWSHKPEAAVCTSPRRREWP